jgi:Fe-S-cluster-containing hydrogenase component 2
MNSVRRTRRRETKFVRLEARRCTACWECLAVCPEQVLGKVDLGWHRHVRIRDAQACNGCKKCVRVCDPGALMYIYEPHSLSVPRQPSG